jgi:hypothetical protein
VYEKVVGWAREKVVSSSVNENPQTERIPTNGNERTAEKSLAARDGKRDAQDDRAMRNHTRRRSANPGTKRVEGMSLLGKNDDGTDLKPCSTRGRETEQKRGSMWTQAASGRKAFQATAYADGESDD